MSKQTVNLCWPRSVMAVDELNKNAKLFGLGEVFGLQVDVFDSATYVSLYAHKPDGSREYMTDGCESDTELYHMIETADEVLSLLQAFRHIEEAMGKDA